MHIFESQTDWHALTPEEKIGELHAEMERLFHIVEMLNQKHHVFTDAINLLHRRIDEQAKTIHKVEHDAHVSVFASHS